MSVCLRLASQRYAELRVEAVQAGMSVPELIRRVVLDGAGPAPGRDQHEAKKRK